MRVLVTGAAGFIGTHVCNLLREHGHKVQGVDCYVSQVHGIERPRVPDWIFQSSVGNHAVQWGKDANESYDAVIHLAAEVGVGQSQYEPARYIRANVMETAQLWEAILRRRDEVKRVVVASSMSVYGEGERVHIFQRPLRRDPMARSHVRWNAICDATGVVYNDRSMVAPNPTAEDIGVFPASVYAQSKLDTEVYSVMLGDAYNIPTIALRFFNVIGEGQALGNPYTGVAAGFACRMLNDQPALVFEDGQQSRDFVHVSDVARAVVAAVEAPEDSRGVFNVCTGNATTIESLAVQLADAIAEQTGQIGRHVVTGDYRVGDVRHCIGDPSAIERELGWKARVPLPEALQRMVGWIIGTEQHKRKPEDKADAAMSEMRDRGLLRKGNA